MDRSSSRIAGWLVPCIPVADLVMAYVLVPNGSAWRQPYIELLAAKTVIFGVLLSLAVLNRWRLVPAFTSGAGRSAAALRRSIATEYALIVAVLPLTAVLTTFYSPNPVN